GNWSLGDYFKDDAIAFSYEFLTSPRWLGFPPERLSVTVFAGDADVPPDSEAAAVWKKMGIPEDRIHFLGRKDNWWGPAGQTGPCGPDTEMFIDTLQPACGPDCKPGCHCGKYIEVWNDVFMQYNKTAEGTYLPLAQKTVDTGMGVDRTLAMFQGKKSVFETELFWPVIERLQEISGKRYGAEPVIDTSFRIIADHLRSSVFIIGDDRGVKPSNLGQGYILRRLIRRSIRHGRKLGLEGGFLGKLAEGFLEIYRDAYPEMGALSGMITSELAQEEERFLETLQKGEKEFEKLLPNLSKNPQKTIPGRVAFRLYDTYGFPIEITEELAR